MCGIFGIYQVGATGVLRATLATQLLQGLRRLEYRGYDSAGLCIGNPAWISKTRGNVDACVARTAQHVDPTLIEAHPIGIAHTRWATHGVPSEQNAHPHTSDPSNTFVVVHNGIIYNYESIRQFLHTRGISWSTETDTEVIPLLLKYYSDQGIDDLHTLVEKVRTHLEGTYALLIMSHRYPDHLVACRQGSPLIIGRAHKGHIYCSSDASALLEYTQDLCYLEDGDAAYISPAGINIEHGGKQISRPFIRSDLSADATHKGEYAHYMWKEICEQGVSLRSALHGRDHGLDELTPHLDRLRAAERIVFLACGTSLHACIAAQSTFERLLQRPVVCENASDFVERSAYCARTDVCICVSQSGETADTLSALQYAQSRGAFCVGLTNTYASRLARAADVCVYIRAGSEYGVGSTKAYTAQVVLLATAAYTWAGVPQPSQIHTLPDIIQSYLDQHTTAIRAVAKRLTSESHILFLGRGDQYATALEAALKFKEIAYIHAEAIRSGELKHGPLALLDDQILCIVFAPRDSLYDKHISTIRQLQARGARVFVICSDPDPDTLSGVDTLITPRVEGVAHGILQVLPIQCLTYWIAVERGINVDQPRNLAKSVTVSD